MISPQRITTILDRMSRRTILVAGDTLLDRYLFGSVERISPEAPVPVLQVRQEEDRLGGAGNVALNVDRLGARSVLLGLCGDDSAGRELVRQKGAGGLLLVDPDQKTIVKTRVIAGRQQIVRIDRDQPLTIPEPMLRGLAAALEKLEADAVIVSDYAKGTVDQRLMDLLRTYSIRRKVPLWVDPKPPHWHLYTGVSGLKPNLREAEFMLKTPLRGEAELARGIAALRRRLSCESVLITRGAAGISAGKRGSRVFHFPAFSHEVFDVTGAGDTVIAVLVLALTAGATLREAVALANAAASIVIERVGASQVSREELHDRLAMISRSR